jgi:hypothetical protein
MREYSAILILLMTASAPLAVQGMPSAAGILPPPGALPGWQLTAEPIHFPGGELWRHINGAAEQYLSYGCDSLLVGYYGREGSESEIAVEIYRMNDELGSFGIYTLERPSEGPFLKMGAQGYQRGGDLNFFGGIYYVKLRAYPEEEAEREAVRALAGIMARKHLSGSSFPNALSLFPRENLVAGSFGLVPRSILGLRGLSHAFVARYQHQDEEMLLHLAREPDPERAQEAFATVQESLRKRSTADLQEITIGGGKGVRGEMKYHGPVLLLRRGNDVVLAVGDSEREWVRGSISLLLTNLGHQQPTIHQ